MSRQVSEGEGVPSVFYRNAIDLNRFSNGIARQIAQENINVILRAVEQLKKINESKGPSYKAARLRALIKQTKKTLSTWQEKSVDEMIKELENVAKVQTGFVENQLKKALPAAMQEKITDQIGYSVNSVAISPGFAKAVVKNTPTKFNLGELGRFNLTAKQGSEVLLPNGETISKAFRGLATKQANQFNQIVRTGLLSGEPTPTIVRQLVGNLEFGEEAKTIKQLNMAGGEVTKMATNQINTIVRTSVNQVSNTASQSVYKANKEVTEEYKYVSTLDSRTSTRCRSLDGQVFKYDEGPLPPQHFGCRSTTVAVINYKKWGFTPPPAGKRASVGGPVPANTTYGKWLYDQRAETKSGKLSQFTPGPEQIKALGKEKAKYFNRLAKKYGPDQAMSKFMREDGSEVSLFQLQKRYGKLENITIKKKTTAPKKVLPSMGELQGLQKNSKLSQSDIEGVFNLMTEMKGEAGTNAKKLFQFVKQRQVFCSWSTGESTRHLLQNPQLKKSMEALVARGTKGYTDSFKGTVQVVGITPAKAVLSDINKGKAGIGFKTSLTMKGEGPGTSGFTGPGRNNIVVRNRDNYKPVKNLKEIIETVKNSVGAADAGQPFRYVNGDIHGVGTGFLGPQEWILTYVHEMGHQIHYASNKPKLSFRKNFELNSYDRDITMGTWLPSFYGSSNYLEQFAETFVQYVFDPVGLKKVAPEAYRWVDETMATALKAPK